MACSLNNGWIICLDHTVLVAQDDPFVTEFEMMEDAKVAQIRIVEATGAEKFAEFLFVKLNEFVKTETNNRVKIAQVEFMENNKNTAIYNE